MATVLDFALGSAASTASESCVQFRVAQMAAQVAARLLWKSDCHIARVKETLCRYGRESIRIDVVSDQSRYCDGRSGMDRLFSEKLSLFYSDYPEWSSAGALEEE